MAKKGKVRSYNLANLSEQLAKFWIIEDANSKSSKTSEESLCVIHYQDNTGRDANDRYVVRLSFRSNDCNLGGSRSQALRRFHCLRRRLDANPSLRAEYHKVMQEYINMGHMFLVDNETANGYYMPHHAVTKAFFAFLAIRTVLQLTDDESANFPWASRILKRDLICRQSFDGC